MCAHTGPEEAIYMWSDQLRSEFGATVCILKHAKLGGSGGMLPQEIFAIYDLRDCFPWLLRPLSMANI